TCRAVTHSEDGPLSDRARAERRRVTAIRQGPCPPGGARAVREAVGNPRRLAGPAEPARRAPGRRRDSRGPRGALGHGGTGAPRPTAGAARGRAAADPTGERGR